MRITKEKGQEIKSLIQQKVPHSSVYLFGSRVRDELRGGDIDILVIGDRVLTFSEKIQVKSAFFKRFGEQKIDLVSFTRDARSPFKFLALKNALPL